MYISLSKKCLQDLIYSALKQCMDIPDVWSFMSLHYVCHMSLLQHLSKNPHISKFKRFWLIDAILASKHIRHIQSLYDTYFVLLYKLMLSSDFFVSNISMISLWEQLILLLFILDLSVLWILWFILAEILLTMRCIRLLCF